MMLIVRLRVLVSVGGSLLACRVFGQKAVPTEPIETDRPDFTEAATVVPYRWLQIESGFTYQTARGVRDLSGPEALLRYGLWRKGELRVGLPNYNVTRVQGRDVNGFGDTYLGAKLQLGPIRGVDVSLIPAVFLPDGSREYSSGAIDPEVKLCLSRELGGPWTLSAMEYVAAPTFDGRNRTTVQQTISLGRDLGRRFAMFTEYAGSFVQGGVPNHVAHVGLTYRPNRDSQFDVHGGASLVSGDSRPFIAGGYAVRF